MKEFINFLKSRTVQKWLLFTVLGLVIFIQLIFLAIRIYTRHGQALSVPDFVGQSLDEASKMADERKLRYEVIDSQFIQSHKPGTIVAQTPSPNTKVKANRTIFLTINAINPGKVDMPNLINLPVRQAKGMIQISGLRIGYINYVPNIAKDFVLKQFYKGREIQPGTKVLKGSAINLNVGMGLGNTNVNIPNLNGLTENSAKDLISSKYLTIGAVIFDNSIETYQDSINAVIYKQKPDFGASVNTGSAIDIWLTSKKNNEE